MVCLAKAGCRLCKRVEYRRQIEGRTADQLEHISGRGLLLQRLAQLTRALLLCFEQACILDGNHRLVGEGCYEIDLLVGER